MTQEEKQLLLVDLCVRLPYGVKANIPLIEGDKRIYTISFSEMDDFKKGHITIIPYLRQMSSMTEEEKEEYHNLCYAEEGECYEFGEWVTKIYFHDTIESIDWLNKNMFDYRGLIEKGLALVASEVMYKMKE